MNECMNELRKKKIIMRISINSLVLLRKEKKKKWKKQQEKEIH